MTTAMSIRTLDRDQVVLDSHLPLEYIFKVLHTKVVQEGLEFLRIETEKK